MDVGNAPRGIVAMTFHVVRWVVVGGVVGVLAGLSSAAFLETLRWATETRTEHGWLLWLLPVAGFAIGLVYHHYGGRSTGGNNLIIDEIHEPVQWIPRRMAPLVYLATVTTHLFGGSAGREGTAIQMSGSLSDAIVNRLAGFTGSDRRLVLIAAISGAFGAVFGVPIAGFVFGLEVQSVGRIRHDAIIPALTASVVGDQVVRQLDVEHTPIPPIEALGLTPALTLKLIVAGVAFGLVAVVFASLVHALKRAVAGRVTWPPLRPVVGGVAVIALTYAVGTRDYLGLSIPLITRSLDATTVAQVAASAFALKLVFTVITLGTGFHGGEVTPLFVIGATLGATLGDVLHGPIPLFAAVGFVAVFGAATNTPLACTIMGVELFGGGLIVPLAIGCVTAYVLSGERGIYTAQRVDTHKPGSAVSANRRR